MSSKIKKKKNKFQYSIPSMTKITCQYAKWGISWTSWEMGLDSYAFLHCIPTGSYSVDNEVSLPMSKYHQFKKLLSFCGTSSKAVLTHN
jgi:hypothetical protein